MRAQVRGTFQMMSLSAFCRVVYMLGPSTWYERKTKLIINSATKKAVAKTAMVDKTSRQTEG